MAAVTQLLPPSEPALGCLAPLRHLSLVWQIPWGRASNPQEGSWKETMEPFHNDLTPLIETRTVVITHFYTKHPLMLQLLSHLTPGPHLMGRLEQHACLREKQKYQSS